MRIVRGRKAEEEEEEDDDDGEAELAEPIAALTLSSEAAAWARKHLSYSLTYHLVETCLKVANDLAFHAMHLGGFTSSFADVNGRTAELTPEHDLIASICMLFGAQFTNHSGLLGTPVDAPSYESITAVSSLRSTSTTSLAHLRHLPLRSIAHLLLERVQNLDLTSGTLEENANRFIMCWMGVTATETMFEGLEEERHKALGKLVKTGLKLHEAAGEGEDAAALRTPSQHSVVFNTLPVVELFHWPDSVKNVLFDPQPVYRLGVLAELDDAYDACEAYLHRLNALLAFTASSSLLTAIEYVFQELDNLNGYLVYQISRVRDDPAYEALPRTLQIMRPDRPIFNFTLYALYALETLYGAQVALEKVHAPPELVLDGKRRAFLALSTAAELVSFTFTLCDAVPLPNFFLLSRLVSALSVFPPSTLAEWARAYPNKSVLLLNPLRTACFCIPTAIKLLEILSQQQKQDDDRSPPSGIAHAPQRPWTPPSSGEGRTRDGSEGMHLHNSPPSSTTTSSPSPASTSRTTPSPPCSSSTPPDELVQLSRVGARETVVQDERSHRTVPCAQCRRIRRVCRWVEGERSCERCLKKGGECSGPQPRGKTRLDDFLEDLVSAVKVEELDDGDEGEQQQQHVVDIGPTSTSARWMRTHQGYALNHHLVETCLSRTSCTFFGGMDIDEFKDRYYSAAGRNDELNPNLELLALGFAVVGTQLSDHTAIVGASFSATPTDIGFRRQAPLLQLLESIVDRAEPDRQPQLTSPEAVDRLVLLLVALDYLHLPAFGLTRHRLLSAAIRSTIVSLFLPKEDAIPQTRTAANDYLVNTMSSLEQVYDHLDYVLAYSPRSKLDQAIEYVWQQLDNLAIYYNDAFGQVVDHHLYLTTPFYIREARTSPLLTNFMMYETRNLAGLWSIQLLLEKHAPSQERLAHGMLKVYEELSRLSRRMLRLPDVPDFSSGRHFVLSELSLTLDLFRQLLTGLRMGGANLPEAARLVVLLETGDPRWAQ
ncbi:hypothetical protein JCM8097_003871 [Rhodosporidiobolus ruineniae]